MAVDDLGVLVTGGAGYIGSHVCKALATEGYRVVVFDDLSAGHRAAVRFGPFEQGDIADTARVRDVLKRHRISAVMHFAALLDVGESVREPARYFRTNVAGTLSVLEAMVSERTGYFILSSTCATYGEPVQTPITEAHPQQPINSYGESKLAVERALPHFERAHGLRWTALRYFNAAGADPEGELGEDHDPEIHLIPKAFEAVQGGPALQIFGDDYPTPDGTCLRDYVHVSDLADGHVRALRTLMKTGRSTAYNLGSGNPHSVRQVIAAVERSSGKAVPASIAPRREGDPSVLFADATRARTELGWQPRMSDLDSIVNTAWNWYRSHPEGYRTAGSS